MGRRLQRYLADPLLAGMYAAIRGAGPLRSIAVDLTHVCDLRCVGCYFFSEEMDRHPVSDDATLARFVADERARGTNFVTVVGGEPSLALDRLKTLYDAFKLSVATNGTKRIPTEGFEQLPIGVSVWGDDARLRGPGVFERALRNYRDDPRAFFYFTVAPGQADQVADVVARCVDNGNRVLFNFYGDLADRGGALDHTAGFERVRDAIDRAIERHPEHMLLTRYLAEVVSTGTLFGERWGHHSCTSITPDHPANEQRIANGRPYSPHFRAYNADLVSTRRCCTGIDRDCGSCFDTWEHFSWIMLALKPHMRSEGDFAHWLTTTYLFYFINRLVDVEQGAAWLPEIHRRCHRGVVA